MNIALVFEHTIAQLVQLSTAPIVTAHHSSWTCVTRAIVASGLCVYAGSKA